MSTCTKDITLVVDPEVCPPGGLPPGFNMWYRLNGFPVDLPLQTHDIGEGPIVYLVQYNDASGVFFWLGSDADPEPNDDREGAYIFPAVFEGELPITWSLVGNPPSWAACDPNTGEITFNMNTVDDIGDKFEFQLRATNVCGSTDSELIRIYGGTVIYWGEWPGAVPGSFTASQIQNDLLDVTNTPSLVGPRISPVSPGLVGGDAFHPFGIENFGLVGLKTSLLNYIDTAPTAYTRVYAVPAGFFSGTNNQNGWTKLDQTPVDQFTFKETISMTVGGLATNYDIYTTAAGTAEITVGAKL